jgi:mannosyltransferase OCH1-like enzyme
MWLNFVNKYEGFQNETHQVIIPKTIHHIWMGSKTPKRYLAWHKQFKALNPEYDCILWDEKMILDSSICNIELFKSAESWVVKSDIARIGILHLYGGFYFDTDFEPLKPLPSKMRTLHFVACLDFDEEVEPGVNNAFLGSVPKGDTITSIMNAQHLPNNYKSVADIFNSVGPHLVTKCVHKSIAEGSERCIVLPSNYLYPFPSFKSNERNIDIKSYKTEDTIAIHYWDISWIPTWKKYLSKLRRLLS